jgi:predicted RNase H-like nuclease
MSRTAVKDRDLMVDNAQAFAQVLVHEAKLRGLSIAEILEAVVMVMAARNPTLAGKVMEACMASLQRHPVTKVIAADGVTVVN